MSEQLAMFAPSNGLGGHKELSIIDRNVVVIARNAQTTSIKAALRAQPRSGTKRRSVFDYLRTHDATDEEIERALNLWSLLFSPRIPDFKKILMFAVS